MNFAMRCLKSGSITMVCSCKLKIFLVNALYDPEKNTLIFFWENERFSLPYLKLLFLWEVNDAFAFHLKDFHVLNFLALAFHVLLLILDFFNFGPLAVTDATAGMLQRNLYVLEILSSVWLYLV